MSRVAQIDVSHVRCTLELNIGNMTLIIDKHVAKSTYVESSCVRVRLSSLNGLGNLLVFFNRGSCWHMHMGLLHLLVRNNISSCCRLNLLSVRLNLLHDLLMGTLVRWLLLLNRLLGQIDLLSLL